MREGLTPVCFDSSPIFIAGPLTFNLGRRCSAIPKESSPMIFDARRALKTKLANRELVRGVLADFPSADLVASLARLGFDLIFIDCEHAGPDFETVVQMTRAARA